MPWNLRTWSGRSSTPRYSAARRAMRVNTSAALKANRTARPHCDMSPPTSWLAPVLARGGSLQDFLPQSVHFRTLGKQFLGPATFLQGLRQVGSVEQPAHQRQSEIGAAGAKPDGLAQASLGLSE